MLAKQI
jgi:hypothetical protein